MIKKVDHIGIAVKSIENALPFYTEVLKLELEQIEEVATQHVKVAFISAGNIKIELLEPTSANSTVAKFIEKRGEGIHHIALGVESIEQRLDELQEKGINLIDKTPRIGAAGANIAFLHPSEANGVLIELCEKTVR
ncbi:methylmalonyl-CoA epimerase [Metabacillus fastidiosus]|uniref:methylmalonyl-CoA epimerase n=1 Tax=Metabacillus fastidiosus TaxID=1458 RepID=UPI000825B322|nr:methylmalonyl-CoA epimerase [Metabacillus fastidiosus]MEC2075450.1 methylmalonyl-CoA epimerase [Metabacillus fastidiosus]MED4463770.1 methylmalonyl-CoA epimerase [Metabacillus fastidiosus]